VTDRNPDSGDSNGTATPVERTGPVPERREHGDDRELLTRRTGVGGEDDGFVWCRTATTPDPAGDGFEWCEPIGDGNPASTAAGDADSDSGTGTGGDGDAEGDADIGTEVEAGIETAPETGTDGNGTAAESEGYSLPRELVTTTRVADADDEAVALLSALRRDPDEGRWRHVAAELDDE
jgi:hypothetical protein